MQFQADIIGRGIRRPVIRETTALGAAYLAGLAVGFWHDLEEIKQAKEIETHFTAAMTEDIRTELLRGWHKAVQRSKDWEE
jgi:glycerol kinase